MGSGKARDPPFFVPPVVWPKAAYNDAGRGSNPYPVAPR